MVGEDGAEAAWLIAQHAIGLPEFQRKCFRLLSESAATKTIPSWQPAYLLDRTMISEGKPQIYGTGFDWDEEGLLSPRSIAQPAMVDKRRAAVGLPPLAEATATIRRRAENDAQPKPESYVERQRRIDDWAKSVGWR